MVYVVALALVALSGRRVSALVLGVLLDLLFGVPSGTLHYLFFPFTLLALVLILARSVGARYIVE